MEFSLATSIVKNSWDLFSSIRKEIQSAYLICIKKVKSPDEPDLLVALEKFYQVIPENELDPPETIVRWIQEVYDETKEGKCKLKDCFLIAKIKRKICGILYCQYYPDSRFFFISYIAIDKNMKLARECYVSTAMIKYFTKHFKKEFKESEGIIFELEYPKSNEKSRESTCLARKRRFFTIARMQNLAVKEIDIKYLQPKLTLWGDDYKEEKQFLMYARTRKPHLPDLISIQEVKKILQFVYLEIYGDHFENDPSKDKEYRKYLENLYKKVVSDLPEKIICKSN